MTVLLVVLVGAIIALLLFVFLRYVLPVFHWGALYVPASAQAVSHMVELARVRPGDRAVDLGCGDGRVVIALAQAGAKAHGYEINPILVWQARRNIRLAGLAGRAHVHYKSFWKENLSRYDIVTIYGITFIMQRLASKLQTELRSGSRIVSHAFPFDAWHLHRAQGNTFLYIMDAKRAIL